MAELDFDEKALEKMVMDALKGTPKPPATRSVLDIMWQGGQRAIAPLKASAPGYKPPVRIEKFLEPRRAPKQRRRSARFPFLEVEV